MALSAVRLGVFARTSVGGDGGDENEDRGSLQKRGQRRRVVSSHHPSTARPRSAFLLPCMCLLQGMRVAVMKTVAAAAVVVVLGARIVLRRYCVVIGTFQWRLVRVVGDDGGSACCWQG